jgi:flagellar FliL protein
MSEIAVEGAGLDGRKKMVIAAVSALAFLIAAGGAAWFFKEGFGGNDDGKKDVKSLLSAGEDIKQSESRKKSFVAPTFVSIDPYIVNLASPDDDRYMQIVVVYQVNNDRAVEALKSIMPLLRSRSLLVLSKKNADFVQSLEGKQRLMDELLDVARVTLQQQGGNFQDNVLDVHFSSLVVQ